MKTMKLYLYTIENKNGYIGSYIFNWTTKKDIVEMWKEYGNSSRIIITKLINPLDFVYNEKVREAFLTLPAIEAIKQFLNLAR